MARKRFRRSKAQYGFEAFIAPDDFTSPEQYKEYGLEVDVVSIMSKCTHPNKRIIHTYPNNRTTEIFSNNVPFGITYIIGETINGTSIEYQTVSKIINWTSGSTKRYIIICTTLVNVGFQPNEISPVMSYYYNATVLSRGSDQYATQRFIFTNNLDGVTDCSIQRYQPVLGSTVTFPRNITRVEGYSFSSNNISITKVIFREPSSCQYIGELAFPGTKIKTVTIPSSVTRIFYSAFQGITTLESVTFNSVLQRIFYSCFQACTSLTSVSLPSTMTEIGYVAFFGCTSLTSFQVPPNLIPTTGLEYGVISNTNIPVANVTSLSPIYTVGAIGTVGYGCIFEEVGGIKKRTISAPKTFAGLGGSLDLASYASGLTSIDIYSFYGCSLITSLTFPSGVTSIGGFSFYSCSGITGLVLPSALTNLGLSAFSGCTSLTGNVNIPSGVIRLYNPTFDGTKISSLTLNNGLIRIDTNAFAYCYQLTEVTIPSTVTYLQDAAFNSCTGIITVTINTTTLTYDGGALSPFANCTNVTTLNLTNGYVGVSYSFKFSQKLALTTVTADALYTSMMNIANGTAGNIKIIHIGATNKINLILNATNGDTVVNDLAAGYKQLNASNTTLSLATTGVAITAIGVASTLGYLSSGSIMLGTTSITYTSITATTFVFTSRVIPAYSVGTVVSEV